MSVALSPITRAYGIALAVEAVSGSRPSVLNSENGAVVVLTPQNQQYVRTLVDSLLTPGREKSDIRFQGLGAAVAPPVLARAVPVALALITIGYLAGRFLK